MAELSVYDHDPTLYLFTSLTAGSSHIVTATSRIETILRANKVPFTGVDTATDDLARQLYQRRAAGKKLPLLVKEGYVIADLEQVEEWNEYDELVEALDVSEAPTFFPAKPAQPASNNTAAQAAAAIGFSTTAVPSAVAANAKKENAPSVTPEQNLSIRQMGAEAAKIAAAKKAMPTKISTTNPLMTEKMHAPISVMSPTTEESLSALLLSPRAVPLPNSIPVSPVSRSGSASPAKELPGQKSVTPAKVESTGKGVAKKVEPAGKGVPKKAEPAGKGVTKKVEPAGKVVPKKVEPAGKGVPKKVEPASKGVTKKVEPASKGVTKKAEPAGKGAEKTQKQDPKVAKKTGA
ncbi:hypothetical protein P280DRAFT_146314 [Massarina eburnea CBS 473.64]|uniref:Uncharacterized protein n=1 Tax=Massarina eburnea CBS 473.64 TaxID=1395130 RepID=A0A6A6RQC2_9PLEO|nr:hypothetical protein P280DRAFT_146314 [Massarina eburnea CBS 473.64]